MLNSELVLGVRNILKYDIMDNNTLVTECNSLYTTSVRLHLLGLAEKLYKQYLTDPYSVYLDYLEMLFNEVTDSPDNMKLLLYVTCSVDKDQLSLTKILYWGEWMLKNKSAEYMHVMRMFDIDEKYYMLMHPEGIPVTKGVLPDEYMEPDIKLPEDYRPYQRPYPTGLNCWLYKLLRNESERRSVINT